MLPRTLASGSDRSMDTAPTVAPFDALRQRLGLNCREFAAALGLSYSSCYNACAGLSVIPRKATGALRELGVDPGVLADEQRQWLVTRGRQCRMELLARLAQGEGATP